MNKEEILEKSRKEHKDEGFYAAENKGRQMGMIAFCCVFIVIMVFNFIFGRDNHAPFAMFWAFVAAEAYPKYKFTKNKAYLVSTVCGAIASLSFLANFIIVISR